MGSIIDRRLLDEKLAALETARTWQPRLISRLERFIESDDEAALVRVNPLRFASEMGIAENEAIDLFLHATKAGLFRLNWQLWCPVCGGVVESFESLKTLGTHYHCNLCHVSVEATLDDYIEITFALAPQVRDTRFNHPERLSIEEFFFNRIFHPDARYPNGMTFAETGSQLGASMFYLEPGESRELRLDLEPGFLAGADWLGRASFGFPVSDGPEAAPETLVITLGRRGYDIMEKTLPPGKKTFRFVNRTDTRGALIFIPHKKGEESTRIEFPPFLSGKRLFNTQTFRDLFRSETIQGEDGISIRDITILFTDLKGSTALYDRIGDLKAFHLVRQHFGSLGSVINRHGGAVVKTIGDAVMATFLDPGSAMKAALAMLDEIDRFNESNGAKEIILKIGIHKGSSIAVTLNDRLDYFGQSVNVASRVQGLADAEEIYITQEMFDVPEVRRIIGPCDVTRKEARLKGIQERVRVFRVKSRRAAPVKA